MKSVLVLTNEEDWPIIGVIDWLKYHCQDVTVITHMDLYENSMAIRLGATQDDKLIKINGKCIDQGSTFWFRRYPHFNSHTLQLSIQDANTISFLKMEKESYIKYLYSFCMRHYKHLGSNSQYNTPMAVNKMEALIQAKQCGLLIPTTMVCNTSTELQSFINKNDTVIIKPMSDSVTITSNGILYSMKTKYVELKTINTMDINCFPSLVQAYIAKSFEVRVFYINSKFYSAAIISQNDSKTTVDYRNYNLIKPNRIVPYKLPEDVENKIETFMNRMGLNTGSLDLIFSKNNLFYFLEVNPVGQYGNISINCNYFLDKIICDYLCDCSPYSLNGLIEEIDTVVLPEFKFTDQQAIQKDSLNFSVIQKYLDQNGYPEIAKVGRRQSRAVGYIILHHFDSLTFEQYIPVVKNLCMEGEAEWDVFAMMTDKLCVTKGEPQVYGTQYDIDSNGRITLYKIDDIEKVNWRRMRIGLGATMEME